MPLQYDLSSAAPRDALRAALRPETAPAAAGRTGIFFELPNDPH